MPNGIWLVMKTTAGSERPFPVRKERTVIGREPGSDLRIAIPRVGARHCELIYERDELRVTDLGSDCGTLHNGKRVDEAVLLDADLLTVGPVTLEIRFQNGEAAPGISVEVKP